MSDDNSVPAPVWMLAAENERVPSITDNGPMTPERLGELRTVLAALASSPIATLEVHPLPEKFDRRGGIALECTSPLAQQLSELITQTARSVPAAGSIGAGGEVLYRMVVPAKVASQVGAGLVRPMLSRAAPGGIHSALVKPAGIAAQATFVPVAAAKAGGALGRGQGVAALSVAAPLILMAVAVGAGAHAEYERQQALERITELLGETPRGQPRKGTKRTGRVP